MVIFTYVYLIDDENRTFLNAYRAFRGQYIQDLIQPLKIIEKRYINDSKFYIKT